MALFSSTQPSLRVRVLPRFPARVLAGNGITITKSGGTYTFEVIAFADIPLTALQDQSANTILGAVEEGPPVALSVSGGLGFDGSEMVLTENQRIRMVTATIFQNGAVLTTGVKTDILVPFSGVITGVVLLADQAGDVVLDIWKDDFADFAPTVADTITAAAKPTLSGADKYQDLVLTGWTTAIAAGEILRLNIDSVATITRLYVALAIEAV